MPKRKTNKKYSGEYKQKVIETMQKEKLSYQEAGRRFEVGGKSVIATWERIYLTEGAEGLYKERRGRACAASGTKKGRPTQFPKQIEEDLLDEVQRLRAEVDYLKKLNALVAERERKEKKQK